ncbi:sigma-70 family RNA polymerase sigma factor [Clostridium paraputrificum]|uniref:RNA polymerase sigma factor n=1 Tax=Clostridium paraputrificum TaxID=29363 RepID=UPI000D99CDD1|nr:RNA polymerase sigma factor [Clostridium paraputrificum]SQB90898.1 sigma-70 family RNA polymerase sigma factor [Clostridium paraputrificum]
MELLVKKAIKGDKEALLKLIMDKKDEYYGLAFIYMKNKDDALDALQEMIVVLYREIVKLKKKEAFYSWSKTILVNICKRELKRKNKENKEEKDDEYIEGSYSNVEDKIYLKELIEKLNEDQKEVIKLRYYLDCSYNDISEITGVPLGTVKSRISKGIDKLRKIVDGELE